MVTKSIIAVLPSITKLEARAKLLAVLDAIMSPEAKYRYFFFDSKWADGERMASQTDGGGDDLFMVFSECGCFMLGFDHESEMSPWAADPMAVWPGVLDAVPQVFKAMVEEPAFDSARSTTFCLWRQPGDGAWQCGEIAYPEGDSDADGSTELLRPYVEGAEGYVEFAGWYYETVIPLDAVAKIYRSEPLDQPTALLLNDAIDWPVLKAEVENLGYPVA